MNYIILANPVADWLIALAAMVAVTIGLDALKSIIARRLGAGATQTETGTPALLHDIAAATLRSTKLVVLGFVGLYVGASLLTLPAKADLFIGRFAITALLIQVALWGDTGLRTWLRVTRAQRSEDPDRVTSSAAVTFLVRVALWAIVALMVLDNLGVNITTLVASLGIGGIAIALAVQSILGDLFASLTVEKIGLKTTRVRSLGGEQIVFSNNDLLKSRIQNLRRMASRRVVFGFGVSHRTPEPILRALPALLEEIVRAQPQVRFDRAHLSGLAAPSFNYEVVYYVDNTDYTIYMDIQQEIYLRIVALLQAQDVALALPVQTVQLTREARPHDSAQAGNDADASLGKAA